MEVETERQEPVLSRQVTQPEVTFRLAPGSYLFRITTLNRFLRPEGSTGWISFQVTAPAPSASVADQGPAPVPPQVVPPTVAPAAQPTEAPKVAALPPAEPNIVPGAEPASVTPSEPAKHVHRNLFLWADWKSLVPGSPWADIYPASPFGAEMGLGYYGNQRLSWDGPALYGGLEASWGYDAFASRSGDSSLAASMLRMVTVSLAPSLTADFGLLELHTSPGGGVVFSYLEGKDVSGNSRSVRSLDLFASGRLAAGLPLGDFLMVETALEYRHVFFTTPMDLISANAGLVVILGGP